MRYLLIYYNEQSKGAGVNNMSLVWGFMHSCEIHPASAFLVRLSLGHLQMSVRFLNLD